ncbi:MAG TPA: YciI family protein [Gemmatimonadota bacterium]|nr:YciI family protein [Gemmatimonadota bacterium]
MRFMILIKANKESEAGVMPDEEYIGRMMEFHEELVKAGVWVEGEGLHPSSKGVRVKLPVKGEPTVIDGPFAETKELVAGYWIWEVQSLEDAIGWVKRLPVPNDPKEDGVVEIRKIIGAEDFPAEWMREKEQHLREEHAKRS